MSAVAQGIAIALVPFILLQSGALIYWAGQITRAVRDHDDALKTRTEQCEKCTRIVAVLANKEGMTL